MQFVAWWRRDWAAVREDHLAAVSRVVHEIDDREKVLIGAARPPPHPYMVRCLDSEQRSESHPATFVNVQPLTISNLAILYRAGYLS